MSHLQSVGGEGINPVVSSGFVVFLDPCLGWSASQVDFHFFGGWSGETTHKHGFLQDVQDSLDPSDWPSLESNTHLNCLEGSGTFEVYLGVGHTEFIQTMGKLRTTSCELLSHRVLYGHAQCFQRSNMSCSGPSGRFGWPPRSGSDGPILAHGGGFSAWSKGKNRGGLQGCFTFWFSPW